MLLSSDGLLVKRKIWIIAGVRVLSDRVSHHLFEQLQLLAGRIPGWIDANRSVATLVRVLRSALLAHHEDSPRSTTEVRIGVLKGVDPALDAQATIPGNATYTYLRELANVVVRVAKPDLGAHIVETNV